MNLRNRVFKYPKSSELYILLRCENSVKIEKELMAIFREKYIQCTEYGSEYFRGDVKEMMRDVFSHVFPLMDHKESS
jgi:hypothetical protein